MSGLIVHHLRFVVEAQTLVELGPQAGAQLRGALYDTLRSQSCAAPGGAHDPGQADWCPVCWLMAREDMGAVRGKDIPRAFAVQPPLDLERRYVPGQRFQFGVSLFGEAISIFPYLVLALPQMGHRGVGYGRGRFMVQRVEAYHPLSSEVETLMMEGTKSVRRPTLHLTQEHIHDAAQRLPTNRITLRFLTPTRLTEQQVLVKRPLFPTLMARLLERYDALNHAYGHVTDSTPWQELVGLAGQIQLAEDNTEWVEVFSGSRRRGYATPISGFMGAAIYEGDLTPFREWLLWGQSLQVGKNTVKGDGMYTVIKE